MLKILRNYTEFYFRKFDKIENDDKLDQYIIGLQKSKLDSSQAQIIYKFIIMLKLFAGFLLYLVGLAIIIIPLSKEYEIMTIYYFNPQDGITISDIFALTILLFGSLIFLKAFKSIK